MHQMDNEDAERGPLFAKACAEHMERLGAEAATEEVDQLKILYRDATLETLYLYDEWVGTSIFALEVGNFNLPSNPFLQLQSEGYYVASFYNLDHIALLDLPYEKYRRLTAPE